MKRRAKPDILVRRIDLRKATMSVSVTAERSPSDVPQQQATVGLVLVGVLTELLSGHAEVELRIYATDAQLGKGEPPAFGVIVVGEGGIRIGAFVRREHWPEIWTLASQGALTHCRIAFTEPQRGQGLVTRLDVSNDSIED